MVKHYATVTLRSVRKHAGYGLLNILGLTVGILCVTLTGLYIRDELSYDRHYDNADRIYRVINGDNAKTPEGLGPALVRDFPEVAQTVLIRPTGGSWLMQYEDRAFYETSVIRVSSTFLGMFGQPLLEGDLETALEQKYAVVISESVARKYFGEEDPIGKVIDGDSGDFLLTVTGVMADRQPPSHLSATFIVSDEWIYPNWRIPDYYTYIMLEESASAADLQDKLGAFVEKYQVDAELDINLSLQAVTDIHLHSHLRNEPDANGDINDLYMLGTMAVLLLLIACINYTNMTLSQASGRVKEVGVRKATGADRRNLVIQFFGESAGLSACALLLATSLAVLLLPEFNTLTGKDITLTSLLSGVLAMGLFTILIIGPASGLYQALYLSGLAPVAALRGHGLRGPSATWLRRGLVTLQFVMAIGLIVAVTVVYEQVMYMHQARLGFEPEQVILLPQGQVALRPTFSALKTELEKHPGIQSVSSGTNMPGRVAGSGRTFNTRARTLDQDIGDEVSLTNIYIRRDFLPTLGMELVAGHDLRPEPETGTPDVAVLLNETAVRLLGFSDPDAALGKRIGRPGEKRYYVVAGVVRNFHMHSFRHPIAPIMLSHINYDTTFPVVRLTTARLPETVAYVEKIWHRINPSLPFSYTFLDDDFARLYRRDEKLGQVFALFSSAALVLACLGLLALTALTVERRAKEIAVRKVLGASIAGIASLLGREYAALIFASHVIAVPIAYLAMERWLLDFTFRIDMSILPFIVASGLTIAVALVTVSLRVFQAASGNPTDVLREE